VISEFWSSLAFKVIKTKRAPAKNDPALAILPFFYFYELDLAHSYSADQVRLYHTVRQISDLIRLTIGIPAPLYISSLNHRSTVVPVVTIPPTPIPSNLNADLWIGHVRSCTDLRDDVRRE
jgi:hypothetical protein